MTSVAELRAEVEARSEQVNRLLTDINDMDEAQLLAFKRDLMADLDKALAWSERCNNVAIQETRRRNRGAHGVELGLDSRKSSKLNQFERARSDAEKSELGIRRQINDVNKRIDALRRQALLDAAAEQSAEKERQREARRKALDRQAVEAVLPPSPGEQLIRWGKKLVHISQAPYRPAHR